MVLLMSHTPAATCSSVTAVTDMACRGQHCSRFKSHKERPVTIHSIPGLIVAIVTNDQIRLTNRGSKLHNLNRIKEVLDRKFDRGAEKEKNKAVCDKDPHTEQPSAPRHVCYVVTAAAAVTSAVSHLEFESEWGRLRGRQLLHVGAVGARGRNADLVGVRLPE